MRAIAGHRSLRYDHWGCDRCLIVGNERSPASLGTTKEPISVSRCMGDELGFRRKEGVMRISRLLIVVVLGALALLPVGSTVAGGWASVEIETVLD